MMGAIRGRMEYDKYRFNHGNVLEFLVLWWFGYSLSWFVALWVWFCSGNPEKPPPSLPQCLLEASCPRSDALLISPSSMAVGERSCFNRVAVVFEMPCLRHRMRSHRGTPRHAPSSELTAGHYPCTRSGRGRFHLPSHYPPDSSSSPSFGFVIFSFNCTRNRPRITTHISVIFHEEA